MYRMNMIYSTFAIYFEYVVHFIISSGNEDDTVSNSIIVQTYFGCNLS